MVVHFVCSGNAYRSRLAEAYLRSLQIPNVQVMSSGARTWLDQSGHITKYGAALLAEHGLEGFSSKDKIQLDQTRLDAGDVTILMNREIYRQCQEDGFVMPAHTYIWDIADVSSLSLEDQEKLSRNIPPAITETTFNRIREHVNELVSFLKRPKSKERIDILDEKGNPTGKTSDISTIHEKGLIHGGVHIGLYSDKGVVLEKRSSNIIFNPGLWDISMGGIISSGETPEQALIREVKEELGVDLDISQAKKIFIWNYNHYLPHYGFHNHNLTHTYIAKIPSNTKFTLQKSEVSKAVFMNLSEVVRMNEDNQGYEKLIAAHSFNKHVLDAIKSEVA